MIPLMTVSRNALEEKTTQNKKKKKISYIEIKLRMHKFFIRKMLKHTEELKRKPELEYIMIVKITDSISNDVNYALLSL
jgi:hypothetical protein